MACFVLGPKEKAPTTDPRVTPEYKKKLVATRKLDSEDANAMYEHLSKADIKFLKFFVERNASGFWLEGTPHTVVRCFEHDVEQEAPWVRQAPYRLKGQDQVDLEKCIQDDLARGQLVEGTGDEDSTSPAFIVRKPKIRMVVDYRKANTRIKR